MTTGGEGGMVTTNDRDLWAAMWAFKDHGKSWDAVYNRDHPLGFRWVHESFGTNWRMIEMQAAIGRIQLRKMAEWTAARTGNAAALTNALAQFTSPEGPLRQPNFRCHGCDGCSFAKGCHHANYKFYTYVRPGNLGSGWSRDRVISEIIARGIPAYQGSCSEVYKEKAFDGSGWRPTSSLPIAKELGETSIMFLVHPTMTHAEIIKSVKVLTEVLKLTMD